MRQTFDETTEYFGGAAAQALPQAFVRRIYEEAEGNPFYTREVFQHLRQQFLANMRKMLGRRDPSDLAR